MIFDIKKLFTKSTTLGRFEYIKLVWGFRFFPILVLGLLILTPPDSLFYYPILVAMVSVFLVYAIINIVATYKRLTNIFEKPVIALILLLFFYCMLILIPSKIVANICCILWEIFMITIPGKKKSDEVMSNKLFWITFSLSILLLISILTLKLNRVIPAESMANTLQPHDRVTLNIFDKNYQRGDIIVFQYKNNIDFVKRIIALPGEKVEIKKLEDGTKYVYINDKKLEEPYVKDVSDYMECSKEVKCEPIIVPENNYYVLGDNRGASFDSRSYGTIDKSTIKGKVSHIYFPFNRRQTFTTQDY